MATLPITTGLQEIADILIPRDKRMPFRYLFGERANLALLLVLFVLLLGFASTIAIVAIRITDPAQSQLKLALFQGVREACVVLGIFAVLIVSAKSAVDSRREREKMEERITEGVTHTRHDLRGALNETTNIVQEAAGAMKQASNGDLPKTREELRELMVTEFRAVAKNLCEEVLKGNGGQGRVQT